MQTGGPTVADESLFTEPAPARSASTHRFHRSFRSPPSRTDLLSARAARDWSPDRRNADTSDTTSTVQFPNGDCIRPHPVPHATIKLRCVRRDRVLPKGLLVLPGGRRVLCRKREYH